MAEVTSITAARAQEIDDAGITSGSVDSSGNISLVKKGGGSIIIPSGMAVRSSPSGGAGRMIVSDGANSVIRDYVPGAAGLLKSDINGVVSRAIPGTDYQATPVDISNLVKSASFDPDGTMTLTRQNDTTLDVGVVKSRMLGYAGILLSAASQIGKFQQVATITETSQYDDRTITLRVFGVGGGNNPSTYSDVVFRVKQQAAMGSAPYVELYVRNVSGTGMTEANFTAVTTQNTVSVTEVELWFKAPQNYENYYIILIAHSEGSYSVESGSATWLASLPAGTQTSGVPGRIRTIPPQQVSVTSHSLNSGSGYMTDRWSIPAGDAKAGTAYRLTANGWLTGTTKRPNIYKNLSGDNYTLILYNANMSANEVSWRFVLEVVVRADGASGNCDLCGQIVLTDVAGGTDQGSWTSTDAAVAFNTTIDNDMALYWSMVNTHNCYSEHSIFERIGPV